MFTSSFALQFGELFTFPMTSDKLVRKRLRGNASDFLPNSAQFHVIWYAEKSEGILGKTKTRQLPGIIMYVTRPWTLLIL